tara:strand:- start:191 stop:370 length:180 start_codon:yes stop_codon:yes gene_type:complete
MNDGPFRRAIEEEKEDVIKEEYIVYKNKKDSIVKETYNRHWHYNNDYYDTSTIEHLIKK